LLRIRLQRRGRRKRPIHHVVVADSRNPRDGRIIEDLGRFDNVTPKNELTLDRDRALYWLKQGAQPSDTVRSIFKDEGLMYQMHLIRWGKSDEEIEEALTEWREKREEKEKDVPTRKERQKALLEAEEKEFQKQLKKKAEEAAREKAKQEALAAAEEEEKKKEAEAKKAEEEAEAEASDDEAEAAEAQAEEAADEKEETSDEKTVEASEETEEEEKQDDSTEEEETEAEQQKTEASEEDEDTDGEEESDSQEESSAKTSTDMLAKEAIDHIESTPVEELEGFITDEEDRVTVRRALEEKQQDEEE